MAGSPTSQAGPGDHLPSTPRSHPQPLAFSGSDSLAPRETLDHSGSHSFQRGNNSRPGRGGGKRVKWEGSLEQSFCGHVPLARARVLEGTSSAYSEAEGARRKNLIKSNEEWGLISLRVINSS